MKKAKVVNSLVYHPCPVVTILGHVDHGKTTLLDTIRKTNIALHEEGGITQHIGAYQITVRSKNAQSSRPIRHLAERGGIPNEILRQAQDDRAADSHTITFIDTPGHEAFSKMRGRGAQVADIAVLVVAANDGVMPQTLESISHIQSAKIPCIVAINKIDLPNINIEKIKKQLTKAGLNLEEYGGDVPIVPLSAKTGFGIDKLLEMILLLSELYQDKKEIQKNLQAVVIEATLSKNRGPVATVIVRHGSLKVAQEVICENQVTKIRALVDWNGKNIPEVTSGQPAEVLGWKKVPGVGSIVSTGSPIQPTPEEEKVLTPNTAPEENEEQKMKLIIKTDSLGSLEAISHGLKDNVEIISSRVGLVTESDVMLAKITRAIIIGFNIKTPESVVKLAQSEKVFIKNFNIIMQVFQEIDDVAQSLKQGNLVTILGEAKIIALFTFKDDKVAGVEVTSGRIARGDQVKVVREDQEIGRARIKSLRHLKDDVTRVDQGTQGGVILSQKFDFLTGDSIISIG